MSNQEYNKEVRTNQLLNVVSVNDLKEKEFNGKELSPQERLAIKNYDRYRLSILHHHKNKPDFHAVYMKLQAEANLLPYTEFIKEKYFV